MERGQHTNTHTHMRKIIASLNDAGWLTVGRSLLGRNQKYTKFGYELCLLTSSKFMFVNCPCW